MQIVFATAAMPYKALRTSFFLNGIPALQNCKILPELLNGFV